MNVVYVANDNYAVHLAVSMASLFDSNLNEEELHVYVISVGISDASKEKLTRTAEDFERPITFLELSDISYRIGYETHTGRFDISAMGRFFLGEVLPPEVDRVLYLDCDTCVLQSLMKLWNTDLKGNILGAVQEPTIYKKTKESIGLSKEDPYYNSGVLLIDLTAWRAFDTDRKLREYYQGIDGVSAFCDQDAINGLLKGKIRDLSPRYNFFSNYYYYRYKDLVRLSASYRVIPEELWNKAKAHPAVVHFAGDERPWIKGNHNPYGLAYEVYLKLTPWKGNPKTAGKAMYMQEYHMMNLLTRVCPAGRKLISDHYGAKLYEERLHHR